MKNQLIRLIVVGVVTCVIAPFVAFVALRLAIPEHPDPPVQASPAATTVEQPVRIVVWRSSYDRIKTGMSYWEVVGIVGSQGDETVRNRVEAVPGVMDAIDTVSYRWVNGDGSNMMLMFQNDKLFQKAQHNLP